MVIHSILDILKRHTSDLQEFHAALFEALKDGKLTEKEIEDLERKREELRISEKALDAIRMQAYQLAFAKATEDQDVTDDEIDEMEQIQDYLGLTDKDVARTKKQLFRMRILSAIKHGSMPVIQTDDLVSDAGEIAHWSEPVTLEQVSGGKKTAQKGELIITNKRIVFRGNTSSIATSFSSVLDVDYSQSGLTIHANRKQPLTFRYQSRGDHSVVASILATAIELRKR